MRVIMTGGGTGGHIYPAIAIADKIREKNPDAEILFVGTTHGLEKTLVPANGYNIEFITVSGFNRRNLLKSVKTCTDLLKGMREAKAVLRRFKPDVVIGTGGYVCGPLVLRAAKMNIPTYIHEQNAFPGMTNKMLAKHVKKIFIAFGEAEKYFGETGKSVITGNPVRSKFYAADRASARRELGIPENAFCILSFGGSQGAGKINETVLPYIEEINGKDEIFAVFGTGKYYYNDVKEKLAADGITPAGNVRILEYIDAMDKYLAAADLVISRSGALTVSEITVCGRASILVPSPNVTGNHQYYNAKAVADTGGAILIEDAAFTTEILKQTIEELMADRAKLAALEEGARKAAPPDATSIIYENIFG